MRKVKVGAAAAAAALMATVGGPQAGAATGTPIVAGPGAAVAGFATKEAVAVSGGKVVFVNLDPLQPHNVVIIGGPALPVTNVGETDEKKITFTAPAPGTYEFYCTPHPQSMRGTLTVV
ncbi:MAG TPA: plastocyanin/azurin family copper-binding protein [Actinomycetota bacterium]|nr:plastocyanin/azurin family copper-binding protein [Actinomycetota bacterium]